MKFIEFNWHPRVYNPIDYVGVYPDYATHRLATPQKEKVIISREGGDFVVTVGEQRTVTGSNLNTCYFLNSRQVGRWVRGATKFV